MWLRIHIITCCTIGFEDSTANARPKYEVYIKANKGKNKQKHSPPMSKYAKNMSPNRSAPSSFNSSLNLWIIPFANTMMLLDSIPLSYLRSMLCDQSSSFVKCFSVFPAPTLFSNSRLKLADIGHFNSDFRRSKASQSEIYSGSL